MIQWISTRSGRSGNGNGNGKKETFPTGCNVMLSRNR
jgi:hypothetical protein